MDAIVIKYKVYSVEESEYVKGSIFTEVYLNYQWSFDTFEEAFEAIKNHGFNYIKYTILPYIYLTE